MNELEHRRFIVLAGLCLECKFAEKSCVYSVFQSAEVQKLWVLGKRQEAKVKREEKYVYLTSLGNAIITCDRIYLVVELEAFSPKVIR